MCDAGTEFAQKLTNAFSSQEGVGGIYLLSAACDFWKSFF